MKNNVDPKQTVEKVACLLTVNGKSSILGTHSVSLHRAAHGATGGGAIADEITRANPMITEAITIATARFPFFISSHSSTGVSQVKIDSKIQRERAMVKMPTAPQPISLI
jgi:hypothetical protein